jgi:hypothetical protein
LYSWSRRVFLVKFCYTLERAENGQPLSRRGYMECAAILRAGLYSNLFYRAGLLSGGSATTSLWGSRLLRGGAETSSIRWGCCTEIQLMRGGAAAKWRDFIRSLDAVKGDAATCCCCRRGCSNLPCEAGLLSDGGCSKPASSAGRQYAGRRGVCRDALLFKVQPHFGRIYRHSCLSFRIRKLDRPGKEGHGRVRAHHPQFSR